MCSVYYDRRFIFYSSLFYYRIRILIPNSYDLNKKKQDIRMRYRNGLPITARVLCTAGYRPLLSHKSIVMFVGQAFSMATTILVSVGSFSWLWTAAG